MKNIRIVSAFLVFFTAFSMTSCGDNEPIDPSIDLTPEPIPTPTEGNFKVDFDGQTFTAATTTVYISGGSIVLNAVRANGDAFGMIINGASVGSYPANDNLIAYNPMGSDFAYVGNHPTDPTADTGIFTVTSVNVAAQTISGTFHFTGYWSDFSDTTVVPKEFTNGVFTDLPYTTSNPTGDTFSANVNTAEFVDVDIFTVTTTIGSNQYISIAATEADDDAITVSVRSNLGVGTYDITGNLANDVVQVKYSPGGTGVGTPATQGSVSIIEKTTTNIKGTFYATVVMGTITYQITQGNFDVDY